MATRVRFTNLTGVIATSLSFSTHWDVTASAVRRCLDVDGVVSEIFPAGNFPLAETSTSRQSRALVQFQSRPLKAQTIAGYVKGQMQCMESDAAADMALAVQVRVCDPINNTTRGNLWTPDKTYTATSGTPGTESYEMATSRTNRKAPQGWSGSGHSLSSVDALDGDILVVEVGVRYCNTVSTSYTPTVYFGGAAASDLPEDETNTGTGTAWLEFSQTLNFETATILEFDEIEIDIDTELVGALPSVGQLWPRGDGRQ